MRGSNGNEFEKFVNERMKIIVELLSTIFSEGITPDEYEVIKDKLLTYLSGSTGVYSEDFFNNILTLEILLMQIILEI